MILSILKHRNFRNYFLADIISGFGSGMNMIGANWFVLKFSGSNAAVGKLFAISVLSGLVVFPFAGTLADRFNRKWVMFYSNLIRAVFILFVVVAFYTGTFRLGFLYFLSAIGGMGWSIFLPASRGLVQEILVKDQLMNGNAFVEISLQVGMFLAAAASGIVYKYWGVEAILIINVATFFISNIFLARINYVPTIAQDKKDSFADQFVHGLKYLLERPSLFCFGVAVIIPLVVTMTSNVVLPGYISKHLSGDSVAFGFADMAYGIGACISGFAATAIVNCSSRGKAITGFFLISTLSLLFLAVNKFVAGLYVAALFFGLSNSSLRIILNTKIMEIVPKSYIGRAMSVWLGISMLLQMVCGYEIGKLIDKIPPALGFVFFAVAMAMGLLAVCYFIRRLDAAGGGPERTYT